MMTVEPYLGEIRAFTRAEYTKLRESDEPWFQCSGQTTSLSMFTALFSLLDTRYGGNGYITFGLPNLNGKDAFSEPKFCICTSGMYLNMNDNAPPEQAELLGQIRLLRRDRIPSDFLVCRGQVLPISEHREIFSSIGNRFGGDGVNTFALPNLDGGDPRSRICYAIAIRGPVLSRV